MADAAVSTNYTDYIDIYCERLAPGLLAEPLNAATNVAFLLAALALARQAKKQLSATPGHWLLISLIALIGVGSGLFHTFATHATMLMDIIPIGLFLLCYIVVFCRQIPRLNQLNILLVVAGFIALCIATQWVPPGYRLNGSISYAPAWLYLLGMWFYMRRTSLPQAPWLGGAALLLTCSITLRSVDMALCASWPIGTHFMWHVLNAALLYAVVRGLLLHTARSDNSEVS